VIQSILFPPIMLSKSKLTARLNNETVLITGASFGVGEQLAYLLAEFNVHLILVARNEEKLKNIQAALSSKVATISIYSVDLSNETGLISLIESLKKQTKRLDVIVSNAGRSILRSVKDSMNRTHDYDRCMAINYFAPVRLISGLLPLLLKSKGHIVNVSAVNLLLPPVANWAAYQSSKSAFDQWLQSAAPELRCDGVLCSSLYFPLIKTRMIEPTKSYAKTPAMLPVRAAKIIAKMMYKKHRRYVPWWLCIIKPCLYLFKRQWQAAAMLYLEKKRD